MKKYLLISNIYTNFALRISRENNRFPDNFRTKTGTQCKSETLPDAVSLNKTYKQTKVTEQECVSSFGKTSLYEDESEDLPVIKSNWCLRDYGHTKSIIL